MATLRKHRGKWQVQIRKDGYSLTKTFQLREDAQRWAREHERRIDLGEAIKDRAHGRAQDLAATFRNLEGQSL